jgi:hypothetical protein
MLSIETNVSGADILASQTIVADTSADISIFPFAPANRYKITVKFLEDINRSSEIDLKIESPLSFVITLINFDKQTGVANIEPIYVANHLSRKVFMDFAVYLMGVPPRTKRVFHFTLRDGGPLS